MTVSRFDLLRLAIVLAVLLFGGRAPAAEDLPAFVAPQDPPEDTTEPAALPAEPAAPLAIEDGLALALMRNADLAVFSWETRAAEARALQAGRTPNPELDFRYWTFDESRVNRVVDDDSTRVILSQEFELGGKRQRRVDFADTERELTEWAYEAKRIEVATALTDRFNAVLGSQRRVAALTGFVEYCETMDEAVSKLVEDGAIGGMEMFRIKRMIGEARIEFARAESALKADRVALSATWNNASPQFTEALGDLERIPVIPDLDAVTLMARQSPAVARWDTEWERGTAALDLARANRVPDLKWGVGVRWEDDFNNRDYLVDLEIALPVFDRKQGDRREAQFNMARARSGRLAAEAATSAEIARLYYDLVAGEVGVVTYRDEILPAARAAFEAFRSGFALQTASLDRLLDARRDLVRAEVDYTDALIAYHRSLAALERVVGQSLE